MPTAPEVASAPSVPRGAMPVVVGLSVAAHVGVLMLAAMLPAPAPAAQRIDEVEVTFIAPRELEAPIPEPEPIEETVQETVEETEAPEPTPRPAAMLPPPRRERVREPEPEPAPPPPVIVAEAEPTGAEGEWTHPEGEEGGLPGGVPGGEGTGTSGHILGTGSQPAPVRQGISRAELRRRLRGYVRGTLSAFVNGRIDYPLAARREHLQGVVVLRIRLASDGRLLGVRLSRSSGHDTLDRAALASVQRLDSMPAPPSGIPWGDERELPLPVTYVLQ
ncbi:MAG TPA: hypothetical protein DEF51_30965 [Myxococcales bacterium]|nr:hypothetical protein [Myxococcales bacterium]